MDDDRSRQKRDAKNPKKTAGRAAKLAATGAAVAVAGSLGVTQPGLLAELEAALSTLTVREAYAEDHTEKAVKDPSMRVVARAPSLLERTLSSGEKVKIRTQAKADGVWAEVTWVQSQRTQDQVVPQKKRERAVQRILDDVRKELKAQEGQPRAAARAPSVIERTTLFGDTLKIRTEGVGRDSWAQNIWNQDGPWTQSTWLQDHGPSHTNRVQQQEIQGILEDIRGSMQSPQPQPNATRKLR